MDRITWTEYRAEDAEFDRARRAFYEKQNDSVIGRATKAELATARTAFDLATKRFEAAELAFHGPEIVTTRVKFRKS